MLSPLAAASPIGLLVPLWGSAAAMGWRCHCYGAEPWLWGGAVTAMGQSRGYGLTAVAMGQSCGYGVALSLLWGRAVAMGWRCHCYGAESWLWGGAVPIGCFSYGLLLPLWGSAAPAVGQSRGYGVALSLQ